MRGVRKAMIRVLLVAVFVIALQEGVRLCYQDWTNATFWSKKERNELEGTLDTLYCGTSLAYYAFNPEIIDAEMGTSGFNLATAAQPYIGTYYLIRETVEKNPIEQIYLTISLPSLLKAEAYLQNYLSAFENMCSWKWKLAYLTAVNQEEVWLASLLYTTQVDSYMAPGEVKENLTKKLLEPRFPNNYAGKGYRVSHKVFKGRDRKENQKKNTWYEGSNEDRIQEEAITYLEKIVEFCKENDIELTLVGPPYTKVFTEGAGDMDGFHQYVKGKADEWGVDFYNFVLYKNKQTVFPDEVFKDAHHLNAAGGDAFSHALVEVMQSDDPYSYFYDSMAEFGTNE